MRVCACLSLAALLAGAVLGQSSDPAPRFEVADVHTSPHDPLPVVRGPFFGNDRYEIRLASMLDLIRIAYGLDPEKILGGPSWLEMDRFDVQAHTPSGSTAESRKLMLQSLLAERFALKIHGDTKPVAAFGMAVGKHVQLKESAGGESGCNFEVKNAGPPPSGGPSAGPINLPVIVYTCKNTTMEAFAAGMAGMPGVNQYLAGQLVADQTGLKGAWDFTVRYTPKLPAGLQVTGENIPFFDALDQQLGLKLEGSTISMPVMVVDSVNRKPAENSPDVTRYFPPLPTEFEVAEIKPTPPETLAAMQTAGARPEVKNGRLYVPGMTLKSLISIAFDINGDDKMVGTQKWMEEDRFDLIAKAPTGVALGDLNTQSRGSIPVNIDALRPMIKALVVDRFKLKTHTEDRPVNTYTLTSVKPRLKKADPDSRTRWKEGIAPDAKNVRNANAALGRMVTCQNVTMAQFAELLPGIAPGYVHTHVVDETGLEGGWDFTFSFSPAGVLQVANSRSAAGSAAGDSGTEASEPTSALSLFDAIGKQLGLKLETQKRPTPVLVIDSVERKPVDN